MNNTLSNFNLDSESYKDNEIEILFNLKTPYNKTDIHKAKEILIKQLFKDENNSLGVEKQREIRFFIDTIATRIQNKINNSVTEYGNNFIIENNNTLVGKSARLTEGRLTDGGEAVPPGYINPINVRTITQTVNIDTRFRPNYYGTKSTQFHLTLPNIQKNVVKMRLSSIELPMSYHAISRTNGNSTCLIIDT